MNRDRSRIPLLASRARRALVALFACFVLVAVGLPVLSQQAGAAGDPCAPVVSKVACENTKTGNVSPPDTSLDPAIEGFTTDSSVNPGQTVNFKINTAAAAYSIDIYRVGWYQGIGTRKITTVTPSATLPQTQPPCLTNATTGLVDCGNWGVSASWNVPSDAVSGVYIAYLKRPNTTAVNEIVFVVRDDSSHADIVVQTADTTWQAYNKWGGNSLYFGSTGSGGAQPGRAYKVSYNRPLDHVDFHNDFWASEAQMVHFLERNGYDVSYQSGIDTDRLGASVLEQHKTFMSSGHDEYWSGAQRANVQAARDAGVNLAFFSGNQMFWKTRYEPSIDGSNTDYRTLVTYKETLANAKIDPTSAWTGTFRDPRFSPPADGGQPENALTGNLFTVNGDRQTDAISVPQTFSGLRMWRNTSVATLPVGGTATFPVGTLGYEWNEDVDNGFRPAGDIDLSSTTVDLGTGTFHIQDYGSNYGGGIAKHSMTLYKAGSGAKVFNSGTVQWSWGIDPIYATPSTDMMQATVNILADLGAQPATLAAGLVASPASTDTVGPTTTISAPSVGATINTPQGVTVTGTATDTGGVVAGVEVSTDGVTWHPAQGTSNWSYTWVPSAAGSATIRARAVDDSANIGAVATRSVTAALQCPCSLFAASATPVTPASGEVASLELGMRFRPDIDGVVSGVRFYKGAGNTGTHTGSLWTDTGQLLTTVTFSGETASGWQQASFPTPVAVTANTTYVISYHAPNGNYSADPFAFSQKGVDRGVLHAPVEWSGGNGVFAYGASTLFPSGTYNGTNYWVDVVFDTNAGAPTVLSKTPAQGTTGLPVSTTPTATFSKAVTPASIVFTLKDPSNATVPGAVSYAAGTNTATFTPSAALAGSVTYTASVSGATDSTGNVMSPISWSFTTAGVSSCPCTIWPVTATPGTASANDSNSVELGVRFTADATGVVNGIRFYKGAGNTGTHTGTLWSATGQQLATATFSNESTSGWQQVNFSSPVPVSANTTYIASYHAPNGNYAADGNAFAASGVDNAPLHATANTATAPNGVYTYAASTAFPNQTWQSTNYWVDVSFTPGGSGPADTTPPTVTATTPVSGATGIAISAAPTATFSEPVQPATIAFTLKDSANANVAGTTTYDSATNVATFTSAAALSAGSTYTASVTGARDIAGNLMSGATSWSFTTAAITSCPCSLWTNATVPGSQTVNDTNSVELGVRFTADVSGVVNGVRFYKGTDNTGTHTGTLWSATGQQLATATFTNETATGWQQVTFSSPVAVTANTQYIASYHAPNGGYAHDGAYFQSSGTDTGSLHAPANTVTSPNGVYAYSASTVFPDQTFNSTNYWVDVLFTPAPPADTTPPTVTATTPVSGATGVAFGATPSATFSEPVQAGTIGFTVQNTANVNVSGTVSYDAPSNTATFTPTSPLAASTVYTARVTGAQDVAGNTMAGTTAWSFTTAPPPDTTPPTVTVTTPLAGATGVATSVTPSATFSEAVQAATVNFTLKDPTNTAVIGTTSYSSGTNVATFTPNAPLANNTVYTASVTGAKDVAGNTMAGTTTWSFTTVADTTPPTVVSTTPASGATGIAVSVAPTVRFSEPMQTPTGSFTMKNATNTNVPGTVTVDAAATTATFTPSAALAFSTTYTLTVSGGKDVAGNTMAGTITWSFTTVAAPDTTPPTVTAMTPAAGATGVALSVAPTATFSEPVQAATIGFSLTNASNTNIPGTVAYNSATNTATFTPSAALANGIVYTASVTGAKDTAGNTMAGTVTRSFTTVFLPVTVTDTTTADFTAGTQSSTAVTETADGEVGLSAGAAAEFGGSALPSGWTSTTNSSGGTTTVAGGKVTVNGTRVGTSGTFSLGRWLEASGTFTSSSPDENIGFATTLASGTPWAVFGTKADGNLYARTQSSGSSVSETNLGTTYLNAAHVFRVEWNLTTVVYKIDGVQVASHSRILLTSMRPIISELATGGASLAVNWLRMGPYAASGTFTSRVFDATKSVAWGTVSWVTSTPAGSSVTVKVRSGDVATPNGTWTAFTTVTNGGTVAATARYRQYQVTITRATDGSSPSVSSVSQTYTG